MSEPAKLSLESAAGVMNIDSIDLSQIDIGGTVLVGAGAIGEGFLYTIARLPVVGDLIVIDPEDLELSNLQRYVLATEDDIGKTKVALAGRALRGSALRVQLLKGRWGELGNESLIHTVCSAVDSAELRIAIQAALPRLVLNAWTDPLELGWSRHLE